MQLLYMAGDKFPTFRVDITVLFGRELRKHEIHTDWILQSAEPCETAYTTNYLEGNAFIGPTDPGHTLMSRIRKHALGILHDLKVIKLVNSAAYDFVIVRNKVIAALIALIACRSSSTRMLYWMSFPYAEASLYEVEVGTARYPLLYTTRGRIFMFLLYKVILPRAFHVFVQSEKMKEDVIAQGIDPAKITAVPMGVQLDNIPLPDSDDKNSESNFRITYLGTLNRFRKIDFLVRVLAIVKTRFAHATLILIGKGDDPQDEEAIENEAARLEVSESVELYGFRPMDEAWRIAQSGRVCVSPFFPTPILNSASPTKLIEYMAMGLPVVANDHPDQRKVLTESKAGYCVGWDEQEFAEAICNLFASPTLAEEMGKRGREYVELHRDYAVLGTKVAKTLHELKLSI